MDQKADPGAWTWQRAASLVFAVLGLFGWIFEVVAMIAAGHAYSPNVMLVLLVTVPLGIYYFGYYAIKGKLPGELSKK